MSETQEVPHSPEAEVSVLGAVMLDPDVLTDLRLSLTPGDFFIPRNRQIYEGMVALYDRDEATDPVSLLDEVEKNGNRRGLADYIAMLLDAVPTSASVSYHAKMVRRTADLRRLIAASQQTIRDAMDPGNDPDEVIRTAEERLTTDTRRSGQVEWVGARGSVESAMQSIEESMRSTDGIIGLRTGFSWLDRIMAGLRDGDLTILAARPRMGKTAFALQVARQVAGTGEHVAVASYEMSQARLLHRQLAAESGIDSHRLRTGRLEQPEWQRLSAAAGRLSQLPMHIQYPPPVTIEGLRSELRRLRRKHPVRLFVVDYLQQMSGKGNNRNNEVEHISRGLKALARDFDGLHVLALAQLSRGVEYRKPPRPMLADLRDSGAIEQDADNVLMLWRPEEYFDDETPDEQIARWQGKAEIIMEKQRDGDTGRSIMAWDGPRTTFREVDTTETARRSGSTQPEWIHQ